MAISNILSKFVFKGGNLVRNFWRIIFWGALWGSAEVTIGHFLHIWALPIGWLIWFPLAYCFMWAAYRQTGRAGIVLTMALVASGIKLIDLLMPVRIDFVINPAVSILLEGLAVFVILKVSFARKENHLVRLWLIGIGSILWRILYAIYISFLPAAFIKISPVNGLIPLTRFLLLESAVNCLLISGIFKLFSNRRVETQCHYFNPHPALSLGLFFAACFIQWKF
jgi:hypothetical protein